MEAFKYGCIVDGEYFCDRPNLSRQLANYISSGQNVVIQGERRVGKSSLVRAAISGMRGQDSAGTVPAKRAFYRHCTIWVRRDVAA